MFKVYPNSVRGKSVPTINTSDVTFLVSISALGYDCHFNVYKSLVVDIKR